jgi:hypothetical protein
MRCPEQVSDSFPMRGLRPSEHLRGEENLEQIETIK